MEVVIHVKIQNKHESFRKSQGFNIQNNDGTIFLGYFLPNISPLISSDYLENPRTSSPWSRM